MSNEEQNQVILRAEEEEVEKEGEEEEEEEREQNEEQEQNDQQQNNQNQNEEEGEKQIVLQKDDEEEEQEVEDNHVLQIKKEGDDNKKGDFELFITNDLKVKVEWSIDENNEVDVEFNTDSKKNLVLHWGVFRDNQKDKWSHIDKENFPPLTHEFDPFALDTDFSYLDQDNQEQKIRINFPKDNIDEFNFVFKEKDSDVWYNNNKNDYHINLN